MTKHEALATAYRLLERAGPKTEILIKSAALRVLVDYPEAVADRPSTLREAIDWARGQADIWRKGESGRPDPTMTERYMLLADAAESTLPALTWKVLAYRHGRGILESWAYSSEIEARQQAHWAITEGYLKVDIEAP